MRSLIVALSAVLGLLGAVAAQARDKIGVIILHGKQGTPSSQGLPVIASNLQSAGHLAVVPSMPWGRGGWESINVTVPQVHDIIEGYAQTLRSQGATRIVVAGQSLGANMALSYAAAGRPVAAVVMLAPGHNPGGWYQSNGKFRGEVDRVRALIEAGKGGESISGIDFNQDSTFTISTTAAVYGSWMNPRGLASMPAQADKMPASVPLFLAIGERDPSYRWMKQQVYDRAGKHPYSMYVSNNSDHGTTAMSVAKRVSDWIVALPK